VVKVGRPKIRLEPDNIVIGEPLVDLESLGINIDDEEEVTAFEDEEVFLPRILKKYGFFKSTNQVRKNRPNLWREVEFPEFTILEIGHRRLCIVVGEELEDEGDVIE
jgi:hypothetical protein